MSSTAKSYNFPKLSEAWVIFHGSKPEKKNQKRPIKLNRKNLVSKRHQLPRKNQVWLMIEMIKHGLQMNPLGNLWINPLDAAISMHVLYTVFYTFHKMLTGRIYLTIKNFFILVTLKHDSGVILEIRCYEVLLGDQRINFWQWA